MKKILTLLFIFSTCFGVFNQVKAGDRDWAIFFGSAKHFIENKSQFNGDDKLRGSQILYGLQLAGAKIYFTKSGLTFRFDKTEAKSEPKDEVANASGETYEEYEEREREERAHKAKVITDLIHLQWLNANPNVEIVAEGQATGYYSYHIANQNITARAFEKITYKNLYPGIDVEYTFNPEGGIEYTLTVHPGADASQVKMKWTGADKISESENGNLVLSTLFGPITDRAPVTFYQKDASNIKVTNQNPKPETNISSRFVRNGKIISFEIGSYDHSQTIVIDPNYMWNPGFNGDDKAMDVETDASGNVYSFGGDHPNQLMKFNSAGVWQWTYNTTWNTGASAPDVWMGTLRTAPTGESYITVGSTAVITKVSTVGNFVWSNTPGGAFGVNEYWELTFNCDYTKLWAGGTGSFGDGYIFSINLANGAQNGSVQVNAANGFLGNEVRSLSSSPNGKLYFHGQNNIGEVTSALAVNWKLASTYTFTYGGPSFGINQIKKGLHAIRASANYIYTLDGGTLYRRDITTGAVINSVAVAGGSFGGGAPSNSGLDLDSCGNVYVGGGSQILKFTSALVPVSSVATPNGTAVYDVCVSNNGQVLASGAGYVCSMNMSACKVIVPICFVNTVLAITTVNTNPNCSGQCTATATANVTTGTSPYTYSWNNGQTTQTATGLCAGTYTVTVNDASGSPVTSPVITVSAPTAVSAAPSSTAVSCSGTNDGTASVVAGGGSPGYTYSWNNSATTSSISNLAAGTYIVTITDSKGCTKTSSAIVGPATPLVLNFQRVYYICGEAGGTIELTASGGTSYTWTPGATLDDSLSSHPLATPFLNTTNYTVTVKNGTCTDTAHVTINIVPSPAPPTVNFLGDSMWVAQNYVHYQWYYNGAPLAGDTLYYLIATQPGNYSVYVTDLYGCKVITSSIISGVTNITRANGIKIFPNPAKDEFTVYGLQFTIGMVNLKVYDAIGQIVYSDQFKGDQKTIKCNWSPGVYFVKVEDAQQSFVGKIMIQ